MNVLLDTCAYLVATHDPGSLPARARGAIEDAEARFWSPVGTWEIVVKASLNRLDFPEGALSYLPAGLLALETTPLPLTHEQIMERRLPWLHKDPFDRLLITQALYEDVAIVTSDRMIPQYPGVRVIWH